MAPSSADPIIYPFPRARFHRGICIAVGCVAWCLVSLVVVAANAIPLSLGDADPVRNQSHSRSWHRARQTRSSIPFHALDFTGAFVSPLVALLGAWFLWWWSRRMQFRYRWVMLILYAISPILVHGTELGRPDHQSLST